jgi:hypothetical protein
MSRASLRLPCKRQFNLADFDLQFQQKAARVRLVALVEAILGNPSGFTLSLKCLQERRSPSGSPYGGRGGLARLNNPGHHRQKGGVEQR